MTNKERATRFYKSCNTSEDPQDFICILEAEFNQVERTVKEQGPTWDFLYSVMDAGDVQRLADQYLNRDTGEK